MAGLVIGSSTSFVGESRIGEPAALPALEIAQVDSWEAANSLNQSITPLTGANRMWLVAVFHTDDGTGERGSVTCSYDNNAVTPGVKEHAFVNAGSFPWGLIQVDVFVANESFIAGRAGTANLSVQNIGANCIVALIQLRNAPSDTDVDGSTTGNPGTSASTSLSTTNEGSQDMAASFPSSRYAHVALALVDGAGTTHLFDFLGRNEETNTTEGAGQTSQLDVAHSGGTVLRASISHKEAVDTGTVSGTGAISVDEATLAGSGTETLSGTAAPSVDEATLAASGLVANAVTGDGAVVVDEAALASSGTETISGTVGLAVDEATVSAAGAETLSGAAAVSVDEATLAGTGAETLSGAAAVTADEATLAGTGTETLSGTVAVSVDEGALAGTGNVESNDVGGAGAVSVDEATLAGTGTLTLAGAGAVTVDEATLAGAGTEAVAGAIAVVVDEGVVAGVLWQEISGAGAVTVDEVLVAGAGGLTISGAAAVSVDEAVLAAAGVETIAGAGAVFVDEVLVAGEGHYEPPAGPSGVVAFTADPAVVAAAGSVTSTSLVLEAAPLPLALLNRPPIADLEVAPAAHRFAVRPR